MKRKHPIDSLFFSLRELFDVVYIYIYCQVFNMKKTDGYLL